MTIWYEIPRDRQDALLEALAAHGVQTDRIMPEGELVGCRCWMNGVATTLEIYRDKRFPERLDIVRHEGVHILHPIRFHRLQQAIIRSLASVEAKVT